jgi:dolichol-phosphate mannosyltransferase
MRHVDLRITVVVLAFNEAENLRPVALELHGALVALGEPFELVIVNDGSTDGTGPAADQLAGELPSVRVVHHERNQGLGGVYRTGFETARGEVVTFFPADGQFDAAIIPEFFARARERDLVLGYLPGSRPSLVGRFLSRAERIVYWLLFGPMPRFQGIFMLRRAALARIPALRSTGRGWAIVLEMILRVHRAGLRIESVPTGVRPRRAGVSKVQNARTAWSNLKQAVGLRKLLRS